MATVLSPMEGMTSAAESNSASLIPSHFQASIQVLQAVSRVCQASSRSAPRFTSAVFNAAKQLTGATWAELLIAEGGELAVCPSGEDGSYSTCQRQTRFPISEQSLPGLAFRSSQCRMFNNPQTSSSYQNLQYRLTPFSPETREPQDAFSVVALPVPDTEGKPVGVLVVFNKIDGRMRRDPFNANDLALGQELCNVVGALLQGRDLLSKLRKEVERWKALMDRKDSLAGCFTRLLGRKKRLRSVLKALAGGEAFMTVDLASVFASVLDADAVTVYEVKQGKLSLCIVQGLQPSQCDDRPATFCALTTQEVLNIKDVATEPLLSGADLPMTALLCCPVIVGEECVSVIEFYRKATCFEDLTLSAQIIAGMASISRTRYRPCITPERRFSGDSNVDWLRNFFSDFSLPRKKETFDYVALFREVETGLAQLFPQTVCSVLVLDERTNMLWTRKGYSSDPLIYTRNSSSIIGALSMLNQPLALPLTGEWLSKEGAEAYAHIAGIVCPIKNDLLDRKEPMGLVIVSRELVFTRAEVHTLESYLRSLSNAFMQLFLDKKYLSPDAGAAATPSSSFLELNLKEKVLEPKMTDGKSYHFSSDRQRDISPAFQLLSQLGTLPASRCQTLVEVAMTLIPAVDSPYRLISQQLARMVSCTAARMLIYDAHRKYLVDKETGVMYSPSGLVRVCLRTCEVVSIPSDVTQRDDFDSSIDSLGLRKLDNLLIVPIVFFAKEAVGVLMFANSHAPLTEQDLVVAQALAFMARELLIEMDDTFLNWHNVIQTGRKQKMLFKWCGELFRVLVHSQERTYQCSSILNRLHRSPSLEDLLTMTLETVVLTINCEGARLILKNPGDSEMFLFTVDAGLAQQSEPLDSTVETAMNEKMTLTSGRLGSWENSLVHPIMLERAVVGALQVWNKKDEARGPYSGFSSSDEATLSAMCKELGSPCRAALTGVQDFTFPELASMLKEQVWSMNNSSFFAAIRQACKVLLDCDKALVFTREGERLVVKPQGSDVQSLVGWSFDIGKGIAGTVALNGKSVNLTDAYEFEGFDPSADQKTGYRTRSMLCMPVTARGRTIAVLQMTNKVSGFFDSTDKEILEMFSDVVAGTLQSMALFQELTTEKNQYTEVLNSIGYTILVLNADGKLLYANKPVNQLLPVNDSFAKNNHYSKWLVDCPVLQSDLDAVRDGRIKRAKRKFQSLTRSSGLQDRKFDYRVMSLEEEQGRCKVVLVLEEVLRRRSHVDFSNPTSIRTENTLQTCISKLADLVTKADNEFQEDLESVISTLKSGNLDHTHVVVDKEKQGLVDYMMASDIFDNPNPRRINKHQRKGSSVAPDPAFPSIELAVLRDWNLNFLEIENEVPYIINILNDCQCLKQFGVQISVLLNFLEEVRELYSHRNNPFHNYKHGVTVFQNVYCVLTSTAAGKLYKDYEQFGLLIAALGHDVDHTGRTNAFEISKETELAIRYHDASVLEQHHAATLFHIISKPGSNVFANVEPEQKKAMRKLMVAAIIATDMSKHFTMVANMSARFKELAEDPLGSRPNDKKETAELILHSSDLSNPTKVFFLSYHWSSALANEFLGQVREEEDLHLPITPFMRGLDRPLVFIKNEISFYSAIVKPLWECMSLWLAPNLNDVLGNLNQNIERLKEMEAQVEEEGS